MTQREFLDTLRKALNGQVPPSAVTENMEYYRSYISDEIKKGRSEADVLDELGDPRLIARSIIDADEGGSGRYTSNRYDSYGSGQYSQTDSGYDNTYPDRDEENFPRTGFHISKWAVLGIVFLVLLIIFSVLFFVFKTAFSLLFSLKGLWFWVILLVIIYGLSRPRRR